MKLGLQLGDFLRQFTDFYFHVFLLRITNWKEAHLLITCFYAELYGKKK
jgi:hypothetical protein